ncbi:MAG TPA: hypothetical protein VK937_14610 [Candidatus Limnocylindria bacterium]|nr:hypothetical protein [Candidatus Limnocylindria bacterium]
MRLSWVIILGLLLTLPAWAPSARGQKDRHSGRFGGVLMTATAVQKAEARKDWYYFAVFVNIKNTGKKAACASFDPRLKATYGLEYSVQWLDPMKVHFPKAPEVSQMLPDEESNGAYVFTVKQGVEPLELFVKLRGKSIHCNAPPEGTWGDTMLSQEVRLEVSDLPELKNEREVESGLTSLPAPAPKEETAPQEPPAVDQTVRVFMTGKKGSSAEANAIKTFRDRCPKVLITTEKRTANYVVELVPASFRQQNMVVVVNLAGIIIYSGTTMNLGNAAKDACAAILHDLRN